ncbi:Rpn family recombination-promoting nuclease/putative transposase [sulfur-oxidizing endosymbiont of Gigantopelta aegis]|uniref:Rpn family recombination-promoting nuclease/putative transposase n=1 Tax=sulfur-oxidizing endosymbiont of Gigantopelta aegis TaxID=2794934 RepID=UPI0018DD56FE|nr:Rpn family recombination-promoting nuclease/putative transposase [sulfur-oxidizing endosymbiont of Gigantopelta aegis]
MKHSVDPMVDCVFKAILGSNEHINLLLNFINSVCEGELHSPVANLTIINPYNEKDFMTDKMSIVDVKANDDAGNVFQIEIQLFVSNSLKQRMLHNWAEIYSRQLKEGDSWTKLKPVISIWLVNKVVFQNFLGFHSSFSFYDDKNKLKLTEHANIHIIELCKWNKSQVENDLDRWTRFFREGKALNDGHLPQYMQTKEMGQAMAILKQFSEKERAYDRYRARINYLRDQMTMEEEKELARLEKEQAKEAKNKAVDARDKAFDDRNKAVGARDKAIDEKIKAEEAKNKAEEAKNKAVDEKLRAEAELKRAQLEIEKLKSQLK